VSFKNKALPTPYPLKFRQVVKEGHEASQKGCLMRGKLCIRRQAIGAKAL